MKINFNNKNSIIFKILIVLAAVLVFSVLCYFFTKKGTRRTFVFPSVDGGEIVETRYLPKLPNKDPITLYVEEILLGSGVERTELLFSPETRLISCFEEKNVLYVNLSENVLDFGQNVISLEEGTKLLKRNIQQNFKRLKSVEIYVDGNSLSEEK